jgi:hypothetical protein
MVILVSFKRLIGNGTSVVSINLQGSLGNLLRASCKRYEQPLKECVDMVRIIIEDIWEFGNESFRNFFNCSL